MESGAITGGRVWGDIPDSSVQPGAGNGKTGHGEGAGTAAG
ncbi:hypothetical protein [Klebsiella pneumoniae]